MQGTHFCWWHPLWGVGAEFVQTELRQHSGAQGAPSVQALSVLCASGLIAVTVRLPARVGCVWQQTEGLRQRKPCVVCGCGAWRPVPVRYAAADSRVVVSSTLRQGTT